MLGLMADGNLLSTKPPGPSSPPPISSRLGYVLFCIVTVRLSFLSAEVFLGIRVNSVLLLVDATQNLSNLVSLLLIVQAYPRPPVGVPPRNQAMLSPIGASAHVVSFLLLAGGLSWEAFRRLGVGPLADGGDIATVAGAGILINGLAGLALASVQRQLGGAISISRIALSLAVPAASLLVGIAIYLTGWSWLDPSVSLAIVSVVVIGLGGLIVEARRAG